MDVTTILYQSSIWLKLYSLMVLRFWHPFIYIFLADKLTKFNLRQHYVAITTQAEHPVRVTSQVLLGRKTISPRKLFQISPGICKIYCKCKVYCAVLTGIKQPPLIFCPLTIMYQNKYAGLFSSHACSGAKRQQQKINWNKINYG